jgi:hypothetical protein
MIAVKDDSRRMREEAAVACRRYICLRIFSPRTIINSGRVRFALVEPLYFQIDTKKLNTNLIILLAGHERPTRSEASRFPSFGILFINILEGIRGWGISHLRPPLSCPTTTKE